ncbi:MAG: hypothetical protein LBT44_00045 [Clostridiales bacterium]|jgi:hypothetical protein|nr:hypothetical protein [Clostridiales bacterium]
MKRAALLLAVIFCALALAGCSEAGASPSSDPLKIGLGMAGSLALSQNFHAGTPGRAVVTGAVVLIVTDANGKIVNCLLDAAQPSVEFDAQGQIVSGITSAGQSFSELRPGSRSRSSLSASDKTREAWNAGAVSMTEWAMGKTAEEMQETARTRSASVELGAAEFREALLYAFDSPAAGGNVKGPMKNGLGIVVVTDESYSASANRPGAGVCTFVAAAVSIGSGGKITQCALNEMQVRVAFDAAGNLLTDLSAVPLSKVQIGSAYGMKQVSSIEKEWHEQAKTFSQWTLGKTIEQVKGLRLMQVSESRTTAPDSPELTSSVTMNVGGFIKAIEKAAANAES